MSSSELSEQPDEEPSSPQLPPVRNPDSDTHEGYADSSPVRVRSDDEEVLEQEEEPELDEAVEWQMAQIAQFASSEHEADSVDSRDECELEGIAWEMQDLESKVGGLSQMYKLVDRLGEGTFSSVYKAIDLRHPQHDNTIWCRQCEEAEKDADYADADDSGCVMPSDGSDESSHANNQLPTPPTPPLDYWSYQPTEPMKRKRDEDGEDDTHQSSRVVAKRVRTQPKHTKPYVALKRIYVTSSPMRIMNELEILALLRSSKHVAHLITAFRFEDQVIAVMPYEKHVDFRNFYRILPMPLIRTYLKCIITALAHSHRNNIIHRDVKPANFLFNPATGQGTLCDFGLAEVFDHGDWHSKCLHSLPCAALNLEHGRVMTKPKSVFHQVHSAARTWNAMSEEEQAESLRKLSKHGIPEPKIPYLSDDLDSGILLDLEDKQEEQQEFYSNWRPNQAQAQAARCKQAGKVGYLKAESDRRPSIRAQRAGTRGFRAPEVLLKCPDQTVAIDVWSVGIILLSFLSRRFPFFQSNDDIEALMEIATIFGRKKMEACAAIHNRTFVTNVPGVVDPEHNTLHQLIYCLNPKIFIECRPATAYVAPGRETDPTDQDLTWYDDKQPLFQAIDLMKKCLALDCTRRISMANALDHPFFQSEM